MLFKRLDLFKNMQFLYFFKVKENTSILPVEYFQLESSLDNPVLGFRDVDYVTDNDVLLALLSDMSAVSRVDSYVTNFKMPWNKSEQQEIFFSVGRLELYIIKENFKFKFVFALPYASQAICCKFNETLEVFGIGCDDGSVHFYKLDKKKEPFHSIIFSEKIHTKRVMGIAIDGLKKIAYSISEDGYIQVIDLTRKLLGGSKIIRYTNYKWTTY